MTTATPLRPAAEALAAGLPPLLVEAEHLATTVILGDHGRRRAGLGDTFWQYRSAMPGDEARAVDWRRSARSDATFVQDKEWQIAQTVTLWVDQSASMRFGSLKDGTTKAERARLLALAAAILMIRGGERVGFPSAALPPRRGEAQLLPLAEILGRDDAPDYGAPVADGMPPHGRALFVSDFLGDLDGVERALETASERGARGVLLQVLDPQEEVFPFDGRTIFESVGRTIRHETLRAGGLRDRYLDRLAARKDLLTAMARNAGWQYSVHHTDQGTAPSLLWLYHALERRAR